MEQQYQRDKNGIRLDVQGGMNTNLSPDLIPAGQNAYLQNVRRYLEGRTIARPPLSVNLLSGALAAGVTSLLRFNDTTPAGPVSGYSLVIGAAGVMYVNTTSVATGLTNLPFSFATFRPNASPQPWAYVANPAASGVTLNTISLLTGSPVSFPSNGMMKVRSDGVVWKQGIAEPQTAPAVTFVGGGTGTTQIQYRYVYRASVIGAPSNPSPESIAGTNSQSNPLATVNATDYLTKITYDATQYEFNSAQLRTTGGVAAGTLTNYIYFHNFGFTVPAGVNIDGIQIDLNWLGQNSGTGVMSQASLFYLGTPYGSAKFPGVGNQSYATDTQQGGNSDKWSAPGLTPDIVNDPSFGFGVRITAQSVGGTDRSFVNFGSVTVSYSTQDASIVPVPSGDPQVDKIDWYRMGGALPNFIYVGTSPNTTTPFVDTLSDLAAVGNPILEFDNYEPFPGIGLPLAGVVSVAAGTVAGTMQVTVTSGDNLPLNLLPGTDMLIGIIAYTTYNRPTSTTAVTVILPAGQSVPSPSTGLTYNIAEPALAATPSPVLWGPTPDNGGAFSFGLDPINTGDLLWTKGNNFDAAPDTNRLAVTSPSEPLMNGTITSELSTVFSTDRFWLIYPNFGDVLAQVTGVAGSQWTLIQSAATRGLYMRYAIDALGAMIAWRAKDCICVSMGGGPEKSISDQIYNLFPHGGQQPSSVVIGGFTVYPPDDTKPNAQTVKIAPEYIFYDYQDTTGTQRTLIYDRQAKGWSVDTYTPLVNCHLWAVGPVAQILTGCTDGTVRQMITGGTETGTAVMITRSENGGDSRAFKRLGDVFVKASVAASKPVTVALWRSRITTAITGFSPTSLTGTGTLAPYVINFTSGFASDLDDVAAQFSWPIGSADILDLWQPDFISLPESIQDRPTDWMDCGYQGNKFIQGVRLELDTFNAAKAIKIERADDGAILVPNESPVTVNGQTILPFTFTPPFLAHMVRITATDGVPWRMWGSKWIFQPFPESVVEWETELTDIGGMGWQHIFAINLPYISTAAVTIAFKTDTGSAIVPGSLTFASSAGQQAKVFTRCSPNKWKLLAFRASSTAPCAIFLADIEVWVKSWGVDKGYRKIKPFGGQSGGSAEV